MFKGHFPKGIKMYTGDSFVSMQKQITSNEIKIHNELLNIFHSVETRRFANRLGPKIFGLYQRFALIVLCKRSGKAPYKFVKELMESRWVSWLQLKEIPSKTTLYRWLKEYTLKDLRRFLQTTCKKPAKLLAVDATGIDSWQRSRHYQRRIGDPNMPYAKLDILIDTETQIIYDHVLRIKPRHDTLGASSMFKRCRLKQGKIVADKGYDSEPLHQVARQNNLELYAPVRKSSRNRPKGMWRKRCTQPDKDYPRRNTVESAIHALKCMVPALRSRLHYMKKREIAVAILVYNIERRIKILLRLFYRILFSNYFSY